MGTTEKENDPGKIVNHRTTTSSLCDVTLKKENMTGGDSGQGVPRRDREVSMSLHSSETSCNGLHKFWSLGFRRNKFRPDQMLRSTVKMIGEETPYHKKEDRKRKFV